MRNGLGLVDDTPTGLAFGLTPGFLNRAGTSLRGAALSPFAAGPTTRPLEFGFIRRGLTVLRFQRFGDCAVGGYIAYIACVVRVGHQVGRWGVLGFAHRNTPGCPGAVRLARTRSAVTISGPSRVTSPAPIVTMTSPGPAAAATCWATAEKSGR